MTLIPPNPGPGLPAVRAAVPIGARAATSALGGLSGAGLHRVAHAAAPIIPLTATRMAAGLAVLGPAHARGATTHVGAGTSRVLGLGKQAPVLSLNPGAASASAITVHRASATMPLAKATTPRAAATMLLAKATTPRATATMLLAKATMPRATATMPLAVHATRLTLVGHNPPLLAGLTPSRA